MMRILVTGSEGFVGQSVTSYLKKHCSADIVPIHRASPLSSKPPIYGVDLLDTESTECMFAHLDPDIVVHLAGTVGGIGANMAEPARFMYENLQMGMNVLDSARRFGSQRVVMVGTVCSYPWRPKTIPFVENEVWDGYPEPTNAPYGIAKRALMEMAIQYNKQYDMSNVCLLPVNMYGPGDNFDLETSHVIPALMRKMHVAMTHEEKSIDVWGNGAATREFMYVEDFAEACLSACAMHRDVNDPINVGTGVEVSIQELLYAIANVVGYKGGFDFNGSKPDGQPRRSLNIDRARELLRWHPKTTLHPGLEKTYQWYLEHVHENPYI